MSNEQGFPMIDQRARLAAEGMYRPEFEGDACGVGLVAATDGRASRRVVQSAVDALKAVWHRGAVDADGKTGDCAGLHIDLPLRFFDDAVAASGHKVRPNRLAVGMIFLPRTDLGAQEDCRTIVESAIIEAGYTIYGWRQVRVDVWVIGEGTLGAGGGRRGAGAEPVLEDIVVLDAPVVADSFASATSRQLVLSVPADEDESLGAVLAASGDDRVRVVGRG